MHNQPPIKSRRQPLAAAALFTAAFLLAVFAVHPPAFNAPDATWVAYWNDSTHRVTEIAAVYAALVAGGALIWFASDLSRRFASRATYAAGWTSAALLAISAVFFSAAPAEISISGAPAPSAEFDRIMNDMGAATLAWCVAPVASFLIATASRAALRAEALPRGLCRAGYIVAAIVAIGGVAYLPLALLPLWILSAGATLSRRDARTPMALAATA